MRAALGQQEATWEWQLAVYAQIPIDAYTNARHIRIMRGVRINRVVRVSHVMRCYEDYWGY